MSTPTAQYHSPYQDEFDKEWAEFLKRRSDMLDQIGGRIQLSQDLQQAYPDLAPEHVQSIADAVSIGMGQQTPPMDMHTEDLVRRAHYYGIPEPEKIPPEALRQMVEARRTTMRQDVSRELGDRNPFLATVQDAGSALLYGSLEAALHGVQKLPFIGDALHQTVAVKSAEDWLARVDEGLKTDMSSGEANGYDIAKAVSGTGINLLAGAATWNALGGLGFLKTASNVSRLGVIGRMAMRGALTSYVLNGHGLIGQGLNGDEAPQQLLDMAMGAAGGAAFGLGGPLAGVASGAMFGAAAGGPVGHPGIGAAVGAATGGLYGFAGLRGRANRSFRGADFEDLPIGRDISGMTSESAPNRGNLIEPPRNPADSWGTPTDPASPAAPPPAGPLDLTGPSSAPPALSQPGSQGISGYFPRPVVEGDTWIAGGEGIQAGGGTRGGGLAPFGGWPVEPFADNFPASTQVVEGIKIGPQAPVHKLFTEVEITPPDTESLGRPEFDWLAGTRYDNRYGMVAKVMHEGTELELNASWEPNSSTVKVDGLFPVGDPDFSKQANIGARVTRQIGRALIKQLNAAGYYPEYLQAERISGAHAQAERNDYARALDNPDDQFNIVDAHSLIRTIPVRSLFRGIVDLSNASSDASQASKVAAILESPAAAEMAQQPEFDDADVAVAKLVSNPGQINIIRNVGDVAKTVSQLVRAQTEGRLMPHQFRVVERELPDYIAAAALKTPSGVVHTGQIHATALPEGVDAIPLDWESGFQTEGGRYLSREEYSALSDDYYRSRGIISGERQSVHAGSLFKTDFAKQPIGVIKQYDILISDGLAITNKRVAQYKEHGFFEGQKAVTREGIEGVIKSVGNKPQARHETSDYLVEIYSPTSGNTYFAEASTLLPGDHTYGPEEVAGGDAATFYETFRAFAQQNLWDEQTAAGIPLADWTSPQMSSQLPRLMEDFFDQTNVNHPVTRAALRNLFDIHRLNDFKALAPEEDRALADSIAQEVTIASMEPDYHPDWLEEMANTKGFKLVEKENVVTNDRTRAAAIRLPDGRIFEGANHGEAANLAQQENIDITGADYGLVSKNGRWGETALDFGEYTAKSYELHDQLSGEIIDVADREAAAQYLIHFNREMPDIGPIGDAPNELVEPAGNPGMALEPRPMSFEAHFNTMEQSAADLEEEIIDADYIENYPTAVGPYRGDYGGGEPPRQPPPPPALPPGPAPEGPRRLGESNLVRQFRQARHNNMLALADAERALMSAWGQIMSPHRVKTLQVDELLNKAHINAASFWGDMNAIKTQRSIAHNESHPWLEEANNIYSKFRPKFLRDGTVTRIQAIANPVDKQHAMDAAGYSAREMEAQHRIVDFNNRFFHSLVEDPAFDINYDSYMSAYMSHIQSQQSQGVEEWWRDDTGILPQKIKFVSELVHERMIDGREMNAKRITYQMIRAAMFHKHVRAAWNQADANWNQEGIPSAFRDFVVSWMGAVKSGGTPEHDLLVDLTRDTLRKVGIPVTRGDMRALYGGVIGNAYRAMLGWRPDVLFRDMIQPLMAGTQVGFKHTAKAYADYLKGGDTRAAMWELGLKHGWVEVGQVQTPNSELFRHEEFRPENNDYLTPGQAAIRGHVETGVDFLWGRFPSSFREGIQGRLIDPLHPYTVLGMVNRLIAGHTGWNLATDGLTVYRSAGSTGMEAKARLFEDVKLQTFQPPIRREFESLVDQGKDEQAAALLANELGNTQFRYGAIEQPEGIRKAGMAGRIGAMLGTFTLQYAHEMKARMTNGTPAQIAAWAARYMTVAGSIYLAEKKSGWRNLGRLQWYRSLTFAGGPAIGAAATAVTAAQGVAAGLSGREPTYLQAGAMRQSSPFTIASGLAQGVFPWRGAATTYGGVMEGLNAPNYLEATTRFLTTGERGGNAPDIRNYFEQLRFPTEPGPVPVQAAPEPQLTPQQQMLLRGRRVSPGGTPLTGAEY